MINRLKQKFKKGFTLIETLVAVLILVTAIAGPLTIASKGLQTALVAKDQTIAYYLAQDAVEYIRFARDTNRLAGNGWLVGAGGNSSTGLSNCYSGSGVPSCYLDSLNNSPPTPTSCGGPCPIMYYDPNNHYFTYNTNAPNVPTLFTRSVFINKGIGGNNDEASLTVTVSWSDLPGITHTITVREDLLNWQ